MRRVLVIVDMQPPASDERGFCTANCEQTVQAIIFQINVARVYFWPIIILEYAGYAPTDRRIMQSLEGYPYFVVKEKSDDAGHKEAIEAMTELPREDAEIDTWRFVGVNTYSCVLDTAVGCAEVMPNKKMEIYTPGCNDWRGQGFLREFKYNAERHFVSEQAMRRIRQAA